MTSRPDRWPTWTRNFVQEPVITEDVEAVKRPLRWAAVGVAILFGASLVVEIIGIVEYQTKIGIALTALSGFSLLWTVILRPRTTSTILAVTTAVALAIQIFSLISRWELESDAPPISRDLRTANVALAAVAFLVLINMPLREPSLPKNDISQAFTEPTSKLRSPEDDITLWQWMSVSWMAPLIAIGSKRQLEDSDVWSLGYEFQHSHLHYAFRELRGSVVRRILVANWIDLVILTVLACVELVARYTAPLALQKLLQAMQYLRYDTRPALKWGAVILVLELVNAQSGVFSLWFSRRAYERSRGEMITMLCEKTLNRKVVSSIQEKGDEAHGSSSADGHEGVENGQAANGHTDEVNSETTPLLGGKSKTPTKKTFLSKLVHPFQVVFSRLGRKVEAEVTEGKEPAHMGKILNLMRNDVYEVSQRFWEAQTLVKKPVGFVLSIALVWKLMGPACLLGVAVIMVSQIINVFLARLLRDREKIRRKETDTRLQETSQYVEAIRHLRWYGWTSAWLSKIMSARQSELRWKVITNLWGIGIWIVNALGSDMMIFATFLGFTAIFHHELRIDVAFPALELLGMLQQEIRGLPDLVVVLLNANVAMNRIQDFMSEPEKDKNEKAGSQPANEPHIELKNASFIWPGLSTPVLKNTTIKFGIGFHVISGPVASGKSALLKALLGELDLVGGELHGHDGPVGYCAQNPWLQSMTIRENILFGEEYDEIRYRKTIEVCALITDFSNFKDGDQSPIGENGIGLSGGQKARVALARAVYSRAKVLFLDDPLSALDQQTAEAIVNDCFKGELVKNRIVVLVTHRLDLVRGMASQRILMTQGEPRVNEEEGDDADSSTLSPTTTKSDDGMKADAKDAKVLAEVEAQTAKKWEDEEKRQRGSIKLQVYWDYVKAAGMPYWISLLIASILGRFFVWAETWFVKEWGEAYGGDQAQIMLVQAARTDLHASAGGTPLERFFNMFPSPTENVYPWLLGLFFILVMQSVTVVAIRGSLILITYSAAKTLFKDIMDRVSNATFHFYDITPVGRLMNRLTSDVGTIDGPIASNFNQIIWNTLSWITAVLIIASITPLFLLVSIALSVVFVLIFMRFLPTSQSLRRLEMASLSPLMSNFGALLEGLMTVRAFCAQNQFQNRVIAVVDTFQKMDHFYWQVQSWLMYRFDVLSAMATFVLTVLAIYSRVSPGLTAFVLVAASKFVNSTHQLCRQYGQLQLDFVSVERIVELLHLPQEPPGATDPPAAWPSPKSPIIFENVTLQYAPEHDPALNNISCTIPGGATTAIIGRTGSGKSTLALSLLGILEPTEGRILIDGISTSEVSKQILRSRITFLAQEPVLFPGTLHKNLDPLSEHSDDDCAAVLTRISGASDGTSTLVGGRPWSLTTEVETGGKNLSHGQRQLVGLARAILRRSAIIIMDEATASIDQETAQEVQRILREELADSTVVTIAHRAEAVHGVESVVELSKGRLVRQSRIGASEETEVDDTGRSNDEHDR